MRSPALLHGLTSLWPFCNQRRKAAILALLVLSGALVLMVMAACGEGASPTAVSTATATPTMPQSEGHQLFVSKGCSACHGFNAQGTGIAPALGGHSEAAVWRQVRAPVGTMPVFPPEKVTNSELELIAGFIAGLPGEHQHMAGTGAGQLVTLHHWMALLALEDDDVPEAIHHVSHITERVTGEHLAVMEQVLAELEEGHAHEAAHMIEDMLAGTADPQLTPQRMRLQLVLSALRIEDGQSAGHHLNHYLELATVQEQGAAQAALHFINEGDLQDAEKLVEELMGATITMEEEEHHHQESEQEDGHEEDQASEDHHHDE